MKKISVFCILSALAVCQVACNRSNSDNCPIRLNQVGFAPDQEKTATIVLPVTENPSPVTAVFILNENNDTVWSGNPSPVTHNPVSDKPCQIVDFSELQEPGLSDERPLLLLRVKCNAVLTSDDTLELTLEVGRKDALTDGGGFS